MRVLLIDVNCKYSSTGKIVYSIFSYLRTQGHDAAICYGRGPRLFENGIFKFGIDLETYIHALLTRITGRTGCYSYFSTRRLIKFVEKYKPDIIHMHELHAYFVNITMLLDSLRMKQIPLIWTFHCEFMYTGKCGHTFSCDNWKLGCGKCPDIRRYPKSLWFDQTRSMFIEKKKACAAMTKITLTVPSPWLFSRVKESIWAKRNTYIIYNGVDTINTFYKRDTGELRQQLNIPQDRRIIISVAQNLLERVGDNIYDIAIRLTEYTFVMIGVQERPAYYSSNIITIPFFTDQDRLAEYYSLADLLLLCSKKETFSMPCAEALSCGTPVVGYNAGAPESIFKAPYALFCEYGNTEKICNLINNRISEPIPPYDCVKYANDNFSQEKMRKEFLKLYLEEI